MNIYTTYGPHPHAKADFANTKEFFCGLECELEGIVPSRAKNYGNFMCEKDGSLRGHGFEFITHKPLDREDTLKSFKDLHEWLAFVDKEDPFSYRTSTHIHVNCLSLEPGEVKTIVLLYALFEPFFFAMVKPERKNNIHCVPLTDTYLPSKYKANLPALRDQWHKYTALNIVRLADLGTIEFRHLHGTGDVKELGEWLHVLENLWRLGQRVSIDEKSLSDKTTIMQWFELIFFPAPKVMMLRPQLFDIIRNSLIDVKFSV